MLRLKRRDLTRLIPAMLAALLAISLTVPGMAVADDTAKPAKKDSPAGVKPKHAASHDVDRAGGGQARRRRSLSR